MRDHHRASVDPTVDPTVELAGALVAADSANSSAAQSPQPPAALRFSWGSVVSRALVAALFATIPHIFYDIECHGLERVVGAPHTYFAISHKRDLDSLMPLPAVLGRRGWRALAGEVHFATRADAFTPGFLAQLLTRPAWLARLLHPLNVGPIIRVLGAHPIESLRARPLEAWLREALTEDEAAAQATASATLASTTIHALALAAGETDAQVAASPLAQLLAWRYHSALVIWRGPELFAEDARRRAEWRVVRTVKRQIEDIAHWFWQGGSLYTAPEGRLTPDGRLSPITSGLHRLLRLAPPDTRIVPIALIYDTMTTRRPRLFVDVAPPIEQAGTLHPHELDARLRAAWLTTMRFTCTQLASGALMRLPAQDQRVTALVTQGELTQTVHQWARRLATSGRNVDPRLLRQASAWRLVGGYIRYAERHGILRRVARRRWAIADSLPALDVAPGGVGYPQAPLAYAYNEFEELLSVSRAARSAPAIHATEPEPNAILADATEGAESAEDAGQAVAHVQDCG
ncbi:MAG TPA: hypothetical protein VMV29_16335 [Ktedonobacterales bacterium]|nr:hypothetical protein [Ktedonobacterales bacterium]